MKNKTFYLSLSKKKTKKFFCLSICANDINLLTLLYNCPFTFLFANIVDKLIFIGKGEQLNSLAIWQYEH